MTLSSSNPKHVLWSLSEVYETPKRFNDSRDDWKGDIKTKKDRSAIVKVDETIETEPFNTELYESALKQLEKDSLELAELFVVKPNVDFIKKAPVSRRSSNKFKPVVILLIAAIIAFIFLINIIRRRK